MELGYKLRRDSGFEFWMNARKYIHVADPSWLEQKTCFQLVIWMHHLAEEFCTSINLTNIYTTDSNTYGDVGLDDEVFLLVFTKSSRSKCLNLIFLKKSVIFFKNYYWLYSRLLGFIKAEKMLLNLIWENLDTY